MLGASRNSLARTGFVYWGHLIPSDSVVTFSRFLSEEDIESIENTCTTIRSNVYPVSRSEISISRTAWRFSTLRSRGDLGGTHLVRTNMIISACIPLRTTQRTTEIAARISAGPWKWKTTIGIVFDFWSNPFPSQTFRINVGICDMLFLFLDDRGSNVRSARPLRSKTWDGNDG